MKKISKKDIKKFNFHLKEMEKIAERLGSPIVSPIFTAVQYFMLSPGGKDNLVELATMCIGYAKFNLSVEKKQAVKGTKTLQ